MRPAEAALQGNGDAAADHGGGGATRGLDRILRVPVPRQAPLLAILDRLLRARNVVLTTHVNADGDGAGSQVALGTWLTGRGTGVTIVNPTPFPDLYRFLVEPPVAVVDAGDAGAQAVLDAADLLVVLDTGEARRMGRLARVVHQLDTVVIDHHPPDGEPIGEPVIQEASASATGELVYDLLVLAGMPEPWPRPVIEGLYAAIVTDTGSFRFANTSPRVHLIAADLIERGVDPEKLYRDLFANVPLRRVQLLRAALDRLEVDSRLPLVWVTVPWKLIEEFDATADDLDGIMEHARSIEGTELAILLRETSDGATKVSFRSNGEIDVNALAREFGGGGHVKAAGALIAGPLAAVRPRVLAGAREALTRSQGQI